MIDPVEDRRRLASMLRDLRTDAGLSTTQLANQLCWSQSKVSKTELGRSLPQPGDVEAWTRATGAGAELRAELVEIATRAALQVHEWRRELAPGRRRKQEEIQRLEAAASLIRVFAPDVVVGLAQTRPYAEAMFRLGRTVGPSEDLEEVVQARLRRQGVLTDQSKRFELVMGETALWRRLVPAPAMRAQLDRLLKLSMSPNVALGVIPFDGYEQVHQYHGFAVLGDPDVDDEAIVLAETVTRGITVRTVTEVKEYIAHFDALRAAALEGDPLREFLQEVLTQLAAG
ncbi:MAG: helix-turn-helix domain-containing protein [Actinomycetota bacterium]|nr:helix-turn-helix domain-containing protein [Actinomycetota bacterium]